MKNFLLRTLSGAVYVALIVSAIILLDNSPVAFLCVFGLFTALGINEMLRLDGRQDTESWLVMGVDMLGGVALFVSFYLLNQSTLRSSMWLLPFAWQCSSLFGLTTPEHFWWDAHWESIVFLSAYHPRNRGKAFSADLWLVWGLLLPSTVGATNSSKYLN